MQEVGGPATGALPATTHLIRPQLFDAGDMERSDWVTDLPAQPTVYATLGTEVNGEPEFYPSVMKMLIAGLPRPAAELDCYAGARQGPGGFWSAAHERSHRTLHPRKACCCATVT